MKARRLLAAALAFPLSALAARYAPGVLDGAEIARGDARIVAWASAIGDLRAGPQQLGDDLLGDVTWGHEDRPGHDIPFAGFDALGAADAQLDSLPVVSLGDGGWITLLFPQPIRDGAGPDFAVFENGLTDTFLELAFVEVSSDGVHFVRFAATSLTPTTTQINGDFDQGAFGTVNSADLNNLAGKYCRGFGTPFDLAPLAGAAFLDVQRVTQVRVRDVVGSIDEAYATRDAAGRIINEPWPTPYETGGFDLDAVAVLNQIPEPASAALLALGALALARRRRR